MAARESDRIMDRPAEGVQISRLAASCGAAPAMRMLAQLVLSALQGIKRNMSLLRSLHKFTMEMQGRPFEDNWLELIGVGAHFLKFEPIGSRI